MVVWWAAIGAAAAADNLAAVVEQVAPSVVRLGVFQGDEQLGNGTGFVVRADGIVATNHHVITDLPGELRAVTRDGKHHAVLGVLADDPVHDLALVKIEGTGFRALPLAEASELTVGLEVFILGSSSGLDQTLGVGIISALRDEFPEEIVRGMERAHQDVVHGPLVQHTATSTAGSSGAPVLNTRGEVVAVQHSGMGGDSIAFGARVDLLRGLVARTNLDAAPRPLGPDVRRNLLISAAVFGLPALGWFAWSSRQRRRR